MCVCLQTDTGYVMKQGGTPASWIVFCLQENK